MGRTFGIANLCVELGERSWWRRREQGGDSGDNEAAVKILLLEDDARPPPLSRKGLRAAGHVVDACATGRDAIFHAADGAYDVLIIDRMVPGVDGLAALKALRITGVTTPDHLPDRHGRCGGSGRRAGSRR